MIEILNNFEKHLEDRGY